MNKPISSALALGATLIAGRAMHAQPAAAPTMLDPNLRVRTVVSDLNQPTSIAFLGDNDMLVLEKTTGRVQRVVNGAIQSTVLDLAVNGASERGLLGIALHPNFPVNPGVYLYWTCTAPPPRNLIMLHAFQNDGALDPAGQGDADLGRALDPGERR
jgi:glucose/arabinose dehydrogenase